MIEKLMCFLIYVIAVCLLQVVGAPPLLAGAIAFSGLLVVEVLPEPLNIFKIDDMLWGVLGILCGMKIISAF